MSWQRIFRRKQRDEELAREIESYLEHEIDAQIATGHLVSRGIARKKLGNPTLIREEVYRMNGFGIIETLWQDFRFAVRLLRKSPGFTTVAVLSLALGIGVNTTMFSVINTVLLHSLPFPHSEQIVRAGRDGGRNDASLPELDFWKEHARVFSSFAGYQGGGEKRIAGGTGAEWIRTLKVSTDFVRTLGIPLALGREFTAEETRASGPQAIILSDGLWRRRFGADPRVVGRGITLDDTGYTVVGILPPSFWFPQSADALVTLRATGTLMDTGTNTDLIARRKDNVTLQQAQAEMAIVSEDFRRARGFTREYHGMNAISYVDWLVGDVRLNLLVLFAATGLLLLISCSNLAALLLTRFAARRKELAVRLALGSSRGRLLGQFFMENLLITGLGASAGLLAAYGLLKGLVAWMPFDLPSSTPIQLDGRVLAFTITVAMATAVAFTLVPLLATARFNLQESLNLGGRSAAGSVRAPVRNVLVIGEVALATTLLIAAGLLIQSLNHMYGERLGFVPQRLITFQTPFSVERQKNLGDRSNFTNAMLEKLQALSGARGVAATNVLPLTSWNNFPTQREGRPDQSIGGMEIRPVTPAYFELMGIPVLRGRSFSASDTGASPPVAVINETLAKAWWPGGSPIGDHVVIGLFRGRALGKDAVREVIGVVGDTKTILKDSAWPTVFVPMTQTDMLGVSSLAWIVKSSGSATLGDDLRRTIAEIDPTQRIRQFRSMDEILASSTASSRFNASLFGIFAGVALVLAAIGVYGLLSFLVAQRRHEIGTRMALGATRMDVLGLFFKQGFVLAAAGLGIGLLGAFFLTRWLESLLYAVKTRDFVTFAAAALVLLLVALIAIYLPARRAAKIDPIVALRYE